MSGYSAVDLSRLPAPTVVENLSFEKIFAEMLADLRDRDDTFDALVESDPSYKVLQVAAYRELLLRQRVNDAARAVMLPHAKGPDLDNLAAFYKVKRLELSPGDPERSIPKVMEEDPDYLERILLSPQGFSTAGPEGAYKFHARGAHPDVLDVSATSPEPGVVLVTVLARSGSGTAGQPVIDAVAAALSADDVRPLTDHVIVQSAHIRNYEITGTIYTFSGPDSDVVLTESSKRLATFVEESRRLGRSVTVDGKGVNSNITVREGKGVTVKCWVFRRESAASPSND